MKKLAIAIAIAMAASPTMAKTNKGVAIYEDTYVMQTLSDGVNQKLYDDAYGDVGKLNDYEIKFQFSLSVPVWRKEGTALMLSYTQLSLWQFGNSEISSPFRETNYKPQVFLMQQGNFGPFNNFEIGYRHQSNGREENISRSWDMGYIAIERVNSKVEYGIQGWYAVNLSDNEDIQDFIPPYELWAKFHAGNGYLKVRTAYNFDTDKGHIEAGLTIPVSKFVGLYFQVWEGYGESLIDYNYRQTRVGAGITIDPSMAFM